MVYKNVLRDILRGRFCPDFEVCVEQAACCHLGFARAGARLLVVRRRCCPSM